MLLLALWLIVLCAYDALMSIFYNPVLREYRRSDALREHATHEARVTMRQTYRSLAYL